MPETRLDAILTATRDRVASLRTQARELARRAAAAPAPLPVVPVPVLRKDFILDELQLYEARGAGASAVLLIVRALTSDGLRTLARAARDQGLGILVEVHSAGELELALAVAPTAVGVNSRDLATFAVDLDRAQRLVASVPRGVPVIAESGIATRADVERMAAAGADLVLVGTSVARTAEPSEAVRALTGVVRRGRPGT